MRTVSAISLALIAVLSAWPERSRAGAWEALSSGVYHLSGSSCPSGNTETENAALRAIAAKCDNRNSSIKNLAQVSHHLNQDQETFAFGLLAGQYANDLRCAKSHVETLTSNESLPLVASDVAEKVLAMSRLQIEIETLSQQTALANRNIDRAPHLQTPKSELREKAYASEARLREKYAQLATIRSSISFVDLSPISQLVNRLRDQATNDLRNGREPKVTAELVAKDLAGAFKQASTLLADDTKRMQTAAQSRGNGLTSSDKNAMARDSLLFSRLLEHTPENRSALEPLRCRLDARYGTGSDRLETTLGIAALGLGAAGVVTRGMVFSRAVVAGASAARSRGLISLTSTRIIQTSAIALEGSAAYRTIDRNCLQDKVTTRPQSETDQSQTCSQLTATRALAQDNCVLALALTGLNYGPAAVGFLRTQKPAAPVAAPAAAPVAAPVAAPAAATKPKTSGPPVEARGSEVVSFKNPDGTSTNITKPTLKHMEIHQTQKEFERIVQAAILERRRQKRPFTNEEFAYYFDQFQPYRVERGEVMASKVPRQFRKDVPTSIFPQNIVPDELIRELPRLTSKQVSVVSGSNAGVGARAEIFQVQHKGVTYEYLRCKQPTCLQSETTRNGQIISQEYRQGDVLTLYPVCGPGVRRLVDKKVARQLFTGPGEVSRSMFFLEQACP